MSSKNAWLVVSIVIEVRTVRTVAGLATTMNRIVSADPINGQAATDVAELPAPFFAVDRESVGKGAEANLSAKPGFRGAMSRINRMSGEPQDLRRLLLQRGRTPHDPDGSLWGTVRPHAFVV